MIAYQLWGTTVHDMETDALLKRVRKLAMDRADFMRQMENEWPNAKFGMAVQVHDRKEIERQIRLKDASRDRLGT